MVCEISHKDIATNADLARAYIEARGCLREEALKLGAIAELADCRGNL